MLNENLSFFHQFVLVTEGNWEKGLCYQVEHCNANQKTSKHGPDPPLFCRNKLYSGCCNTKTVHCKAYSEELVIGCAHVLVFVCCTEITPPDDRALFTIYPSKGDKFMKRAQISKVHYLKGICVGYLVFWCRVLSV